MRRRLAKAVFALGGKLQRIKTWHRLYRFDWPDKSSKPTFTRIKGGWLPWQLSTKMRVVWSERLDPHHWEHWALVHEDCRDGDPCPVCGGWIDPEVPDEP